MNTFEVIAALITVTALFSYVNYRWFKLPASIGVMMVALIASMCLIALNHFGVGFETQVKSFLRAVDFDRTLMQGMLSFLLFAGALQINLNDLAEQTIEVTALAVGGVVISMFVFATGIYYALYWLGLDLSFAYCLLFGALISPTDPIAVLGIMKSARAPKTVEIIIAAESLFNDGVGVVAFTLVSELALEQQEFSSGRMLQLFAEEALGGVLFGLAIGWIAYLLLKSVDNYQVEVLITLALVSGGYALALACHTSGPIAIVVAGLLIGNHGRRFAMSERTRAHLDTFWELIDETLNAILFVLIGLEVLLLTFTQHLVAAGLVAVPVILFSRWASVALPMSIIRIWRKLPPGVVKVMTWGGLRGGISVAMALSLPDGTQRHVILAITYVIVIFSILAQGLTMRRVVVRTFGNLSAEPQKEQASH